MSDPVLHLVAGPNGSGKSTFYDKVLYPVTGLPFVNADDIAAARWTDAADMHAYEAAELAAQERARLIAQRDSFATETVFSHPSKLELIEVAVSAGYLVTLHVLLVPEDLAVARVENRVENGGHSVPEEKIRGRFGRLWSLVRRAIDLVEEAHVYDNSRLAPHAFRPIAHFRNGHLVGPTTWPTWTPAELRV